MKLTIARHGQTTWNVLGKVQGQADAPLTEFGQNQARTLVGQLQQELSKYDLIYCSEMQRAYKTAEILSKGVKTPLKVVRDARLNSRNLGIFSGMTLKEIEIQYPTIYPLWRSLDPSFCPPNGESTQHLLGSAQDFLKFLSKKHPSDARILVISHRENLVAFQVILKGMKFQKDALSSIKNCFPYHFQI